MEQYRVRSQTGNIVVKEESWNIKEKMLNKFGAGTGFNFILVDEDNMMVFTAWALFQLVEIPFRFFDLLLCLPFM
jgi:hypothetical protein